MIRIEIKYPEELIEQIDAARGDVTRSTWLRRAAEMRLLSNVHPYGRATPMDYGTVQSLPNGGDGR